MRRATMAVLVLLAVAGCFRPEVPEEPSPSPSVSVTQVPTPSSSPAPPTTSPTTAPTASPSTAAPRGPARAGDVDGDGREDEIGVTAARLTVRLSGGGTVTAGVSSDSPRSPELLGSHDVDRDGRAEVFLLTAAGASTQFASVYRYDGTTLRELRLGDEPAQLGMGGTATHGNGFGCTPGGLLEVRSASSEDGRTYTVTTTAYRLRPTELVRVRSATATAKQGDPAVERAYTVDCGGVGDGS